MFLLSDYYDDEQFFTNQDGLWKVSVVHFKLDLYYSYHGMSFVLEYEFFIRSQSFDVLIFQHSVLCFCSHNIDAWLCGQFKGIFCLRKVIYFPEDAILLLVNICRLHHCS